MSIKDIIALLPITPTKEEQEILERAYNFSENAHRTQKRQGGEPYFTHVFETAKNLASLGMTPITVAAGLLHDVIEDEQATAEEIEKQFGNEILFLVEGVTKVGKIQYHGIERYNESLRKLFVATSQDIRVILIKLCDRLHNMRTLKDLPEYKQQRIAKETLDIYARIAYRLGIRKIQRELENLAFPYVYPKEYAEIKELVQDRYKEGLKRLQKFQYSLRRAFAKAGFTHFKTDYRIKSLYSLHKKYLRKKKDIKEIYDILAIRVITPTVGDCYKALGIIHGVYRPVPGRVKDYIAFPKPGGYQSIHTTIFAGDGEIVEIQIKTEEMFRQAEYGMHFIHKNEFSEIKDTRQNPAFEWVKKLLPSVLLKFIQIEQPNIPVKVNSNQDIPHWIKELAEYQASLATNKEDFVQNLRADFFNERIFAFTPKGDVIDLPIYSTPVDFAYSIHSDIGDHMAGAKVNGKLVSFDTTLHNGDIVEIIVKPTSIPTSKWLDVAKTTLARKHIKYALEKMGEKF